MIIFEHITASLDLGEVPCVTPHADGTVTIHRFVYPVGRFALQLHGADIDDLIDGLTKARDEIAVAALGKAIEATPEREAVQA